MTKKDINQSHKQMFKTATTRTAKADQAKCSEKIVAKAVLYYNTKQGNTKIVLQHNLINLELLNCTHQKMNFMVCELYLKKKGGGHTRLNASTDVFG